MSTHIRLHLAKGGVRKAELPFADASHVIVDGACPHCSDSPFKAAGVEGSIVRGHDTYTSSAVCLKCKQKLGKLVLTVSTIFGIEEDERVLVSGRCRVY